MKPANYAPVYCALYPELADLVRKHGYALAIHGTLGRDMDLIAVPWVSLPDEPKTVVDAITTKFAVKETGGPAEIREHGRLVYTLSLAFGECFIDLSFTPKAEPAPCNIAADGVCEALECCKDAQTKIKQPKENEND